MELEKRTKLIKMKTNPEEGERVFEGAVKCVQKPQPPAVSEDCGWCGVHL